MKFFLSFLSIYSFLVATAQSPELKKGMHSFESGNYEDAVVTLSDVMNAPEALKSKEISEGWYYLGRSKQILISNAMSLQSADLLKKYKGYDLDAYHCYKQALATDEKGELQEAIKSEIESLYYVLFNSGNAQYLSGENSLALNYYNVAAEIAESQKVTGDYQVYNLRGQTHLSLQDSLKAYADFARATERYLLDAPEIPDANIGYSYYFMAMIERYSNGNLNKALELTQLGNNVMDKELERLTGLLNDGSSDNRMLVSQSAQFNAIMDALNRFELEIYRSSPEKYDEAVAKFKKALANNPDDANMWLVYGNLIEYKDIEGSYEAYLKAIDLNPKSSVNHFNAGANRVNKGTEFARKANDEFDYQKSKQWQEKVDEEYRKALIHLEKAYELEPENIYIIDALLQITVQLELLDDYNKYKEKQKILRGY